MSKGIPSTLRRVFALGIDMLLVYLVTVIATMNVGSGFNLLANYDSFNGWTFSYYNGNYFVAALIGYFLITGILFKNTPGKALLKLRVISRKDVDEEVTTWQWILRSLGRPLDFLIGLPLIMLSKHRSSAGDLLAQTQVVKKPGYERDYDYVEWKELLRKGLGLLIALVSFLLFFGIVYHIPKIIEINAVAQAEWQKMSNALSTRRYEAFYETTSSYIKQEATFEEFNEVMNTIAMNYLSGNITVDDLDYEIHTWNFSPDYVLTQGYVGRSFVEMVFIYEDLTWQLAGFNVIV